MTGRDWEAVYREADLPWDTGSPDPLLVEFARRNQLTSGKALEVGCGTGTNCLWLAEQGLDVLGVDISPTAVQQAEAKAAGAAHVRFACLDFLSSDLPDSRFDLVFDRGCFHGFDDAADRALFAERVADALAPDGRWVSIIGSTEGPARDHGPPRRTARDVANAVEPALELVELRATQITANIPSPAQAWFCVARPREVPAQASTRR